MLHPALPLLAALLVTSTAAAQVPERARVMILGVYHFESPNLDFLASPVIDHLTPEKQAEIAEVLDRLAAFEPTKIVLEAPPGTVSVEQRYAAYLADDLVLAGDEREQLGFQLARQFEHPRVYLADHPLGMDIGAVLDAARTSGDERFLAWFDEGMGEGRDLIARQSRATVRDALRMLNEPALLERTRALYLQFARVHGPEGHVGAEVLARWYQRNFCIFDNLARVVESPRDRVLVLFGQNHAPYLRELVQSSPDMELVEPNAYLSD
jgi:hypothetical protein